MRRIAGTITGMRVRLAALAAAAAATSACGSGGGAGNTNVNVKTRPPCLARPAQAVLIGDSYVTGFLSPPLQPALAALDPVAAGFRNYAVAGTSLASGGGGLIPPQFASAVAADPAIQLVIMSAGGNDILLCDESLHPGCRATCSAPGSSSASVCSDIVASAFAVADTLMDAMAAAGVRDVIYFFYPHVTAKGGGYTEILDYARPLAQAVCEGTAERSDGRTTCHFVDLVAPFAAAGGDLDAANFSPVDGIHPSAAGQDIVAQQIWSAMQKDCIGMTSASGCCAP